MIRIAWTADQLPQYGIRVTPPRIQESTFNLDGILDNETNLDIKVHTTDAAGYTVMMFVLFDLLSMQFSPPSKSLWKQNGTVFRLFLLAFCPCMHY